MAQKEAVAWGIAKPVYGGEFELFEITTERGRKVWGRNRHGEPSNRAAQDVAGRFATRELAEEALRAVQAIAAHHAPLVREAEILAERAKRQRREAIDLALANFRSHPVEALEPHR